jgi:hypothetical protein
MAWLTPRGLIVVMLPVAAEGRLNLGRVGRIYRRAEGCHDGVPEAYSDGMRSEVGSGL